VTLVARTGPPEWERRALARAFSYGLQAEVRPAPSHGGRTYYVPSLSEPGLLHTVALTHRRGREHLACSCPAGALGRPCAHAAAVWLYRLEAASGGQVLAVRPPSRPCGPARRRRRAPPAGPGAPPP
jgi:hypothetical protein